MASTWNEKVKILFLFACIVVSVVVFQSSQSLDMTKPDLITPIEHGQGQSSKRNIPESDTPQSNHQSVLIKPEEKPSNNNNNNSHDLSTSSTLDSDSDSNPLSTTSNPQATTTTSTEPTYTSSKSLTRHRPPSSNAILNTVLNSTIPIPPCDGYKHVRVLIMNHVPKCASTVSWQLYHAYHNVLKVPNITTKQRLPTNAQLATPQNVWLEDTFSFALFRDPLGRIHSSYYDKCVRSNTTECPNYFRRGTPGSFYYFLVRQHKNPKSFFQNGHYSPMSSICNYTNVDVAFQLEDPMTDGHLRRMWLTLGAVPKLVKKYYPLGQGHKKQFHHHKNKSKIGAEAYYDCDSLRLALPLTQGDYNGPYKQFFPMPAWAFSMKERCNITDMDVASAITWNLEEMLQKKKKG